MHNLAFIPQQECRSSPVRKLVIEVINLHIVITDHASLVAFTSAAAYTCSAESFVTALLESFRAVTFVTKLQVAAGVASVDTLPQSSMASLLALLKELAPSVPSTPFALADLIPVLVVQAIQPPQGSSPAILEFALATVAPIILLPFKLSK